MVQMSFVFHLLLFPLGMFKHLSSLNCFAITSIALFMSSNFFVGIQPISEFSRFWKWLPLILDFPHLEYQADVFLRGWCPWTQLNSQRDVSISWLLYFLSWLQSMFLVCGAIESWSNKKWRRTICKLMTSEKLATCGEKLATSNGGSWWFLVKLVTS